MHYARREDGQILCRVYNGSECDYYGKFSVTGSEGSSLSPVQRKIREDMATQGWSWVWVFDPHGSPPPFAYTIGFEATFNHSEVVVAGLSEETSESILNSVQSMVSLRQTYGEGDTSNDILEGFSVRFREIPQDLLAANLVQVAVFYGDRSFNALQLVWPDRDGNFPGEEGAPAWLTDRQALAP